MGDQSVNIDQPSRRRHVSAAARAAASTAALVALVVSGACTPSRSPDRPTPSTQAGRLVEPCALVTTADIDDATGWTLPAGTRGGAAGAPRGEVGALCTWEDPHGGGLVQIQFHEGRGHALYDVRRAAARGGRRPARDVTITGADAAFDIPSEGLLGMTVGDDYVQISVIGGTAHPDDHRQLAATIANELR